MAFVNEGIASTPEEALIIELMHKYNFNTTDASFDRDRHAIFMRVDDYTLHKDYYGPNISKWLLWVDGVCFLITKEILSYEKISKGHYCSNQKIINIESDEIISDFSGDLIDLLVEAMKVYKEGGVFSTMTHYDLTVDVSGRY